MIRHVFFVLALGSGLLAQCPDSPTLTPLSSALNSLDIVNFDDLGFVGFTGAGIAWASHKPLLVSPHSNQTIISGSNCYILNGSFNTVGGKMNGAQYWAGSTTEKPGFYVAGDRYALCQFQFTPPISVFVLRANSDTRNGSVQFGVYDENSQLVKCGSLPQITGLNVYTYVGFNSIFPISSISFVSSGPIMFLDNLEYIACGKGYAYNGSNCVDVNECLYGLCGDQLCENGEGTYRCYCAEEGYEFNNVTLECNDIDECSTISPCSSLATCSNTNGSFTCTCQAGYEGSGVGADGCTLIQAPITSASPSSSNTPSGNGPIDVPSSEPNSPIASERPVSRLVSSAHLPTFVSVLAIGGLFILSLLFTQ